jgi:hypothetical protein
MKMTRRAVAIVTLVGVLVSPLAVMWCTCVCAGDDDANGGAQAASAVAAPVVSAQDDCPAAGLAGTLPAVVEARERSQHTSFLLAPTVAANAATAPAHVSAARPAPRTSSQSPPGGSLISVLRI